MDPVSEIAIALALGAAAGLTETASKVINDAYHGLKRLILDRYSATNIDVEQLEKAPESERRRAVVEEELRKAGAGIDIEAVAQAQTLIKLVLQTNLAAARIVGIEPSGFHVKGTAAEGNETDLEGTIAFNNVRTSGELFGGDLGALGDDDRALGGLFADDADDKIKQLGLDPDDTKSFVSRYLDGDPSEGYDDDEAATVFQKVTQNTSPEQMQRAARLALENMTPKQRSNFANMLNQRQAGQFFAPTERGGGGSSWADTLGGDTGIDDLLGGLMGGGSGGGVLGGMLDSPTGRALIGGIAVYGMTEILGGADRGHDTRGGPGGIVGHAEVPSPGRRTRGAPVPPPLPKKGRSTKPKPAQDSANPPTGTHTEQLPPISEPTGVELGPPATALPITCHVRAEMDKTVRIGRVASLEVTVSREVLGRAVDAAAKEQSISLDPSRQLIIQVVPKANVEIVGKSRKEIAPPAPKHPQSLYFDIRPTDLGRAQVWVVVRQGQLLLTTLKLAARVVKSTSRAGVRNSIESDATEATPLAEPLHQLRIFQQERGGQMFYSFELEAPAFGILGHWESRGITGDVENYVSSLYTKIEKRWLSSNQDVQEFTEELRSLGVELLNELVPEPLQQLLWDNRERFTSIQILGDEPFIPWELVHLKAPGESFPDETRFMGQMGLVRWLYDGGWPPNVLRVRSGRSRYVIPDYPDQRYKLPETVEERKFLETTFGATAVVPQPKPVQKVLSTPDAFDLLHFACHGVAESDSISDAQLILEGRLEEGEYIPAHLTATTAEQRSNFVAPDGLRPMVVLNACQAARAGYRLTGIGGFAQAFLRAHAGAFIGTLWSVGDVPARMFTETFYSEFRSGRKVSEAAVLAREQARTAGDATWLAYVVYAHPHATLTQ